MIKDVIWNINTAILNAKLKSDIRAINKRIPVLVKELRKKEKIKVLFLMPCLAKWKTESLYCAMLNHPRFNPVIGIGLTVNDYPSRATETFISLREYVLSHDYDYIELKDRYDLEKISPDIVFLQEAAGGGMAKSLLFQNYKKCLYCYIAYGFLTVTDKRLIDTPYHKACWRVFSESKLIIDWEKNIMDNHAENVLLTGIPMTDQFMVDRSIIKDPWKSQNEAKKRIIWAPHHTIFDKDILKYGTFLRFFDVMLQLAEKYHQDVQWAFKPHPILRAKLYTIWGKERTDNYYNAWADMESGQLEEGEYVGLFMHSDAIIHDSASFIVEYLYMHNPCMYLVSGAKHELNPFGEKCFGQYYFGHNAQDIESFIKNVINGVDPRKEEREEFIKQYLLPPNGKTACENIINAILGEEEYANM